ncbi:MAG: hypothetical protein ACM3PB_00555 [Betaproteobacteria bacterium]
MSGVFQMERIAVKSVLNKHKSRDSWFLEEYSTTPYRGCQFNCVYCYIQGSKYGSHASGGLAIKDNAGIPEDVRADRPSVPFISGRA